MNSKDFKDIATIAPFRLTAAERQWVADAGEPYTYNEWMIKLTEERKKELTERFIIEDNVLLEMDSHGCNQHLCIFRDKTNDKLYTFQYGSNSYEAFYGEWGDTPKDVLNERRPVFEVKETTKTIITYVHPENNDEIDCLG